MKTGATVVLDKLAQVAEGVRMTGATRVMVGFPLKTTERRKGAITNAALGYIHENGAPEANVPARPFLIPGIRSAQREIEAGLRSAADAAFDANPGLVSRRFDAVGLIGSSAVKRKINEGVPPPLKASTLAARRRRGRTGDKPLIDTGQLRNAVTYVKRGTEE